MTTEGLNESLDEEVEEQSDKDRNFAALRKKSDAFEAEMAELRPLKRDKMIREAGYDPDSDQGTAIQYLLKDKGVDAPSTSDGVKELVSTEYPGWTPKAVLSAEEVQREQAQTALEGVRKESESDTPLDLDDQIAEAETAGDYGKSGMLKLQRMTAAQEQQQS